MLKQPACCKLSQVRLLQVMHSRVVPSCALQLYFFGFVTCLQHSSHNCVTELGQQVVPTCFQHGFAQQQLL
jgi:hypothetical protein